MAQIRGPLSLGHLRLSHGYRAPAFGKAAAQQLQSQRGSEASVSSARLPLPGERERLQGVPEREALRVWQELGELHS